MPKVAQLQVAERATETRTAQPRRRPRAQTRYFAFLSYSHKDEELAEWLHSELEQFRVPPSLVGRLTANGVVPKRLTPIFRDEHELAAADDLSEEIEGALASSQFLVVLCSPNAARSRWTNAEVDTFKRTRPDGCVLAVIGAGEPFASDMPGREHEECFPPALRHRYDRRGRPTGKRAEPLAADLREEGDGRRLGFLKLVAGMLGVGLDELVQRETTRRHRRMALVTAASLVAAIIALVLMVTALQGRDAARDERREAEALVAYMVGDLREKLEPIGELDALDGVGARVLAYYSKQNTSELSDAGLLQRARALSLTAEVAYLRGQIETARRLYGEAMEGTAEAVRRAPDDPQRLYDHAQNVFWMGDLARQRGNIAEAERAMREYKRLADRMVALDPNNMKWRMEQQSGDTNLGVALFEHRQFGEARAQFARALATIEGLAAADPRNESYQKLLSESQSWLASGLTAEGRLGDATALRERHVGLLNRRLQQTGDTGYREKLVPAERYLGELYRIRGNVPAALQHFRAAVAHSDALVAREPENRRWSYFAARARMDLANGLLTGGGIGEASAEVQRACNVAQRLIATDSNVQRWRAVQRDCWIMQAHLAVSADDFRQASRWAQLAVQTARTVNTTDPVEDKYALAHSYRLLGDIKQRLGDLAGARAAWHVGLSAVPSGVDQQPKEMAEHAKLLQRLGRTGDAQQLSRTLDSMGFREPTI